MKVKMHCKSCGVPWTDHMGIEGTCKRLDEARGALKVIHTWSDFRQGEALDRRNIINLCVKTLGETAPGPRGDVNG